ncbi:hypothetical protein [Kutzneria sp. NPDC051319]|uniref:hypothetical protein n=1 Tax=Kutzneria sp. NPDC051319 TaxID=3155047 RepID=UPI00343B3D8B
MFVKTIIGGAVAATALLAVAPAAFATDYSATQLNDGATTNVYQLTGANTASGHCPGEGHFVSSELTFSDYHYNQSNHFYITMSATATVKPGVAPGTYSLSVDCQNGSGSASFTVPAASTTTTTTPAPPAEPQGKLTVQLNAATAEKLDAVNVYQTAGHNVAYGNCPGGKGVFSSSALTFGDYQYIRGADTETNVNAAATLKPGIVAGAYKLTMTCGDKTVSTTFKVPGKAVVKPVGAPQTGGGGAATLFV